MYAALQSRKLCKTLNTAFYGIISGGWEAGAQYQTANNGRHDRGVCAHTQSRSRNVPDDRRVRCDRQDDGSQPGQRLRRWPVT